MEVHVDRDAFLRGLQMVHNVVEPRQTLPILANVLLEAEGESLRMTATDLEVGVRVSRLPAKVVKRGPITMSARKLMEIVKELPSAPLALKVQENAWVALRCGGVVLQAGRPRARRTFPRSTPAATTGWLTLDGKVLRDMLAQTSFAISHDESRYALNGVLFAVAGQGAPAGGHRRASAGPGRPPAPAARARRCPGSCRARLSRRSRASWGRGGSGDRDRRQPVHAPDAERAPDGAAHRGDLPELRAGRADEPSAPGGAVARGAHCRRCVGCRSCPRSGRSRSRFPLGPAALKLTAYHPGLRRGRGADGGRSTRARRSRSGSTRATCSMRSARRTRSRSCSS